MDYYNGEKPVNVGSGSDVTIKELTETIIRAVGFEGEAVFDKTKPDGTMKKLLDSSYVNSLGWKAKVSLDQGIRKTYDGYRDRIRQL